MQTKRFTSLDNAVANREAIRQIRSRYLSGEISREEAKILAAPIIEHINQQQKRIYKKWGKKYYPNTFTSLMR